MSIHHKKKFYLVGILIAKSIKSYGSFENVFLNTLNKHAPIKKKC